MAYDRYDTRREWRGDRSRWQGGDDRFERGNGWNQDRDRHERGWFERAGDEVASWFGDEEAERRRRMDQRFGGHLRNEDDVRSWYEHGGRGADRDFPPRERGFGRERFATDRDRDYDRGRAFMSDEDFSRYERSPRWRDEGYRRPYTGRFAGRSDFGGPDRGSFPRGGGDFGERMERGGSYYGVGAHHDRHYGEWRARQIDELDRDYDEFARENRSRFEDEFSSWREKRQQKRGLLGQVREHMEVLGSDGEHVGTVDRTAGDRLILTRSDPESGGAHHSLMCSAIDRVEGNQVILDTPAEEAKKRRRDESRERALFEREDQGEMGPGVLGRSFSGTY
jgi:hypothetical protein